MRFLAIQPGSHSIETLTLTDTETGYAINLWFVAVALNTIHRPVADGLCSSDAVNVVVHKRKDHAVLQTTTPAEVQVTV